MMQTIQQRTGKILSLAAGVMLLNTATAVNAAQVIYDWVPDRGSGGSGFIIFDDTTISDPENFDIRFDNANVIDISFTFDNGFEIDQAINFDGMVTLQEPGNLGNLLYEASNGVIDGWSFEYTPILAILPTNQFLDVTTTGLVCVIAPCPAFTADLEFIGTDFVGEYNSGSWHLRETAVPVPAAAWLFGSGLIGLAAVARRRYPHAPGL